MTNVLTGELQFPQVNNNTQQVYLNSVGKHCKQASKHGLSGDWALGKAGQWKDWNELQSGFNHTIIFSKILTQGTP